MPLASQERLRRLPRTGSQLSADEGGERRTDNQGSGGRVGKEGGQSLDVLAADDHVGVEALDDPPLREGGTGVHRVGDAPA